MGKFISNLFLGALAIALSIFTGSRTLDLLNWALPPNQTVYQWLGLAAFEGGMYFWSFYFIYGAKGTPQRSISICMAVFSVVAVCVATVADLSLGAANSGKIPPLPPSAQQALIIFLGVVIALNVAAYLACKLMSIDKLKEAAEQNAEDMIHAAGLRAISSLAPHIASQAAPHLAEEWAARTWQRLVPGIGGQTRYVEGSLAQVGALPPVSSLTPPESLRQQPASQAASAAVNATPAKKAGLFHWPFGKGSHSSECNCDVCRANRADTGELPSPAPTSKDPGKPREIDLWKAREQAWEEKDAKERGAAAQLAPSARPGRPDVAAQRRARRQARLRAKREAATSGDSFRAAAEPGAGPEAPMQ